MADFPNEQERPAAHMNVVRGDALRRLSFIAGAPARLIVGSASDADLRIARAEVAPRQLDVVWDGDALWLQDALRLGRTFVNGHTLNEWVAVQHHSIVSFGAVRLWMLGPSVAGNVRTPNFSALERARVAHGHEVASQRRRETGRITIPPELKEALSGANGR